MSDATIGAVPVIAGTLIYMSPTPEAKTIIKGMIARNLSVRELADLAQTRMETIVNILKGESVEIDQQIWGRIQQAVAA